MPNFDDLFYKDRELNPEKKPAEQYGEGWADSWERNSPTYRAQMGIVEEAPPVDRQQIAEENMKNRSEFTRNFLSKMDETQGMLFGAAGLAGSMFGMDKLRDWGFEGFKRNVEEASLNPSTFNSVSEVDWTSPGDVGTWFAGITGGLVPTMATIMTTAAIGATAGTAAGPGGTASGAVLGAFNRGIIKKVIGKRVEEAMKAKGIKALALEVEESAIKKGMQGAIAKGLGEKAARQAAQKAIARDIGASIGTVVGSAALESGGMWTEGAEKFGVEKSNPYSALGLGLVSGATEVIAPSGMFVRRALGLKNPILSLPKEAAENLLKRVGTKDFAKAMLKAAPGAMAKEGIQEFTQELIATLNNFIQDPSEDMLSPDNIERYVNAAAAGAAAGVLFGLGEGYSSHKGKLAEARDVVGRKEPGKTEDKLPPKLPPKSGEVEPGKPIIEQPVLVQEGEDPTEVLESKKKQLENLSKFKNPNPTQQALIIRLGMEVEELEAKKPEQAVPEQIKTEPPLQAQPEAQGEAIQTEAGKAKEPWEMSAAEFKKTGLTKLPISLLTDPNKVDLVRGDNNLRRTLAQQTELMRSIRDEGLKNPIEVAVDKDGKLTIIEGTHRIKAFQDLTNTFNKKGFEDIPVQFVPESLSNGSAHKYLVDHAKATGKKIPDSVLKDYQEELGKKNTPIDDAEMDIELPPTDPTQEALRRKIQDGEGLDVPEIKTDAAPYSVAGVLAKPATTEDEVKKEKVKLKSQVIEGVKAGKYEGAVRFGTVDEIRVAIENGKLPVSEEYGEIHATPILGKDDDTFAAYGAYDKHNMAIIIPQKYVKEKVDAHTKEVLIDENVPLDEITFLIDGHERAYTYQELKAELGRAKGEKVEQDTTKEPKWHNFGAEKRKEFYDPDSIDKAGPYQVWDFDGNEWIEFKDKAHEERFRKANPYRFIGETPAGEEKIWYRYGAPPEGNRSYNNSENKGENGVSAYATPSGSGGAAFFADRDVYSGKGRQVGWGSDGEPLIIPTEKWKKVESIRKAERAKAKTPSQTAPAGQGEAIEGEGVAQVAQAAITEQPKPGKVEPKAEPQTIEVDGREYRPTGKTTRPGTAHDVGMWEVEHDGKWHTVLNVQQRIKADKLLADSLGKGEAVEPKVMTEEEFLASKGASRQDIGEAALHKNRAKYSDKQWKRIIEAQSRKDAELVAKRDELRKEYGKLKQEGKIGPPNRTEQLITTANGHADNESTQAARRILEKQGVDWKKQQQAKPTEPKQTKHQKATAEYEAYIASLTEDQRKAAGKLIVKVPMQPSVQLAKIRKAVEGKAKPVKTEAPHTTATRQEPVKPVKDNTEIPKSPDGNYQIYTVEMRDKDGSIKTRYGVPSRERKTGGSAFGNYLFDTLEGAAAAAESYRRQDKDDAIREAARVEEEKKAQAIKAERENIDGFGEELTPMQKGRVVKALNTVMRFNGKAMSVKEKVKEIVNGGGELSTHQTDVIKPMSRMKTFRATNREQAEHERRVKEAGKKTVYMVGDYDLGKTAYDYAKHLVGQKESKPTEPVKDEKPVVEKAEPVKAEAVKPFQRTTPSKGTPEREVLDKQVEDHQAKLEAAYDALYDAEKTRDKSTSGSKKWDTAQRKVDKLQATYNELLHSPIEERGRIGEWEDAAETGDELQQIEAKRQLGMISDKDSAAMENKLFTEQLTKRGLSGGTLKEAMNIASLSSFKFSDGLTKTLDAAVAQQQAPTLQADYRQKIDVLDISKNDKAQFKREVGFSIWPDYMDKIYKKALELEKADGPGIKGQRKAEEIIRKKEKKRLAALEAAKIKLSDIADKPNPEKFYSRLDNGELHEVKGNNLKIFTDIDLFTSKDANGKWAVTEGKSGFAVSRNHSTQKEAIAEAKELIEQKGGAATTNEMALKMAEKHGLSPRWAKEAKAKDEQYSTTQRTESEITAEAIKSMPIAKSWTVTEKDGAINVRTRSGHGFTIQAVSSVTPDQIQFEAGYGRQLNPEEGIAGKYEHASRQISIVKGVGDKWTAGHEFMHFLEKSGLVSGMDIGVLQNHIKQLHRQGKFKTVNEKDVGGMEDRAKFVETVLYDRGQPGIIRNIIRKIADAIDAFVNLFTRTARGVVRGIEAGKVGAEQTGVFEFAQDVAMSVKQAAQNVMDNPAFKKWFGKSKVVDESGQPLVVYHSTNKGFDKFELRGLSEGYFFSQSNSVNMNPRLGDDKQPYSTGAVIVPVYLNIRNPKYIKRQTYDPVWENTEIRDGKKEGYDGLIFKDDGDTTYVAFHPTQIKSIFNRGTFDPKNPDVRYAMAGPKAKGADTGLLAKAKAMKEHGKSREQVWKDTGWWEIVPGSGEWKFEIDDSNISLKKPFPSKGQTWGDIHTSMLQRGEFTHLGTMLDAPELFAAYPELVDLSVSTQEEEGASYHRKEGLEPAYIDVGEKEPMYGVKGLLLHEIEHAIQQYEGFARGGNLEQQIVPKSATQRMQEGNKTREEIEAAIEQVESKYPDVDFEGLIKGYIDESAVDPKDLSKYEDLLTDLSNFELSEEDYFEGYQSLTGEAESRLVQKRLDMTPEQKKAEPPWITLEKMLKEEGLLSEGQTVEDVLISRYDSDEMYSTPSDRGKQAVSAALQQTGMSKAEADKKAAEVDKEYEAYFPQVTVDTAKGFWNIVKRLWADRNRKEGRETWISRVIGLPAFWKHPRMQLIFGKGLSWIDNKEAYFQEATTVQEGPDKGRARVQSMADFEKQRPGEFKDFERYIHHTDISRKGFSLKQNIDTKQWEVKNPKGTVVFRSVDEKEAKLSMYNLEAAEYMNRPNASEQGANALLDFRMINDADFEVYAQPMRDIIEECELNGTPIPEVAVEDENGNTVMVNMRVALADFGDLRGTYMPRLRKPGSWKVVAKKGDKQVFRIAGNKVSAHTMAEALKRDGYEIETIDELKTLGEDVYEMAGQTLGIQEILNQALGNVGINAITKLKDLGLKGKMIEHENGSKTYELKGQLFKKGHADALEALGGVHTYKLSKKSGKGVWMFTDPPEDIEQRIEQALFKTMGIPTTNIKLLFATHLAREAANIVRQHGARSRMIGRGGATGENVWLGYETNPIMAATAAAKIASGMKAKHEFAIDVLNIISGTDVSWKEFKETPEAMALSKKHKEEIAELIKQRDEIKAAYNESIKEKVAELVKLRDATEDKAEKDKINFKLSELRKKLPEEWYEAGKKVFNLRGALYEDYQNLVNKNKIDAARDKEEFLQATTYFKDMLRNDDQVDRIIGTIRGLAVLKFLSFRPAAAVINLTALVTSFPAALSHYGGVKMHRAFDLLPKAMNQYWNYSQGNTVEEWTKKALDHIHKNGWHNPQYNREAMSYLQGRLGSGWRKFTEVGMLMFVKSEQLNRVSSVLAAYQGIREKHSGVWTEGDHLRALETAKLVSDQAHGTYSKANYPHLARGDNAAAQTIRTFYVFKTFQHTYLLNMLRMGFSKECLYMALSPAILAGANSSVLMPMIGKVLAAAGLGGDDPEEELYNYVAKNFGEGAENFARFGLTGMAGVSLKGSLAVDPFGIPMTIGDVLGAPGSVISDIWEGGKLMLRGDVWKGFEKLTLINALGNVSRGIREATEGVTTYDNAPKFYGDKPIVSDTIEAAFRMLSFSPARLAGIAEKQWKERKIDAEYQDKRTNIYARIKRFYIDPPAERDKARWIDILSDIQEYNAAAKRSLVPGMTMITQKSIKASLRRASKPSKRERLRE